MIAISDALKEISLLEPIPRTAVKLAALIADSASTMDQITEVIRYDPALTADILKLANSAFSGSQRRIVEPKDAVVRLGGARILERLLGKEVRSSMQSPLDAYGYGEDELWRHSVAAAAAAEMLSTVTTARIGAVSFTAALLHDIGKLIISRIAPAEAMEEVRSLVSRQSAPLTGEMAENKVLGFSHADIGARVASAWQLPDSIVAAIRDHHDAAASVDPVTDSVKIANLAARSIGEGLGREGMSLAIDNELESFSRSHIISTGESGVSGAGIYVSQVSDDALRS